MHAKHAEYLIQQLRVLVVDDNAFMRTVVRGLLHNIGVKKIYEAGDGIAALEIIRESSPDVVVLDWEMPLLNGPELVRIVRSPGVFPVPDVPIIMLTGHVERWRVIEASRLGVNEFLKKPVSYWLEELAKAGVPSGPINDFGQVFADPHVRARGMEIKVEHPFEPALSLIRNPITFSETPIKDYRAPPLLGGNTREVLASRLGYDDAKLDALKKREII